MILAWFCIFWTVQLFCLNVSQSKGNSTYIQALISWLIYHFLNQTKNYHRLITSSLLVVINIHPRSFKYSMSQIADPDCQLMIYCRTVSVMTEEAFLDHYRNKLWLTAKRLIYESPFEKVKRLLPILLNSNSKGTQTVEQIFVHTYFKYSKYSSIPNAERSEGEREVNSSVFSIPIYI